MSAESTATLIATLVILLVILVQFIKTLLPGSKKTENGYAKKTEIGSVHEKINNHCQEQNQHCADQLRRCTEQFQKLAVSDAEVGTKLDGLKESVDQLIGRLK